MKCVKAFLCLPVLALAAWPAFAEPNLVITNARVFTADASNPVAESVAVEGTRITFVGTRSDAMKLIGPSTRVIDAGGRLVVPGLIEAHAHAGPPLPGTDVKMPNLLWPGPTAEQAIARVRAAAPTGQGWITGTIGAATVSRERDWRTELDAVASDRPVRLRGWWGHGTIVNSRALQLLGIDDKTPDPIGGWYGRTPEGRLSGLIREQAEVLIDRQLTEAVPLDVTAAALRSTADQYAGWGVTSLHQMAHNFGLDRAMAALRNAQPKIRWIVYGWNWPKRDVVEAWTEFTNPAPSAPLVRIGGIKWILDATPVERDALLRADYADRPGHRGRSNYSDEELRSILRGGLASPQQLALHVAGDGEMSRLFAAMEQVAPAEQWRSRRVRIEHGDGLTPDLIPVAKRLGIVVVQNPLHILPDKDETGRPWYINRVGEARARRFQLLKSLLDAGIPLALGSDAGGDAANPFLNIMFAVRYERNPAEALTREQALAAYTSGGAFAERQEHRKGRIAVGLEADLALLSQDILTVPLEALPATRSLLTIVGGEIAHEDLGVAAGERG